MDDMNFRDFLSHVYKAGTGDSKSLNILKTTGYLEEGQGSMGGATVPQGAFARILDVALEKSIVRPLAVVARMDTDAITISRLVDTTHASSVLGGITAAWTKEGTDLTESNPAFGDLSLVARKLPGYCYTSSEWLDDSIVTAEDLLIEAFGEAIAFYCDVAYFTGSGVNEPLGVINAPCTISVAKESGQTADTVVQANVVKMDARLAPSSDEAAVWYINQEVKPQLKDDATNESYLKPETGADGKRYLYSHRVRVTEKCPKVGDVGDILLADFSRYMIGDRGLTIKASRYYKFDSDNITWRFVYRGDGQPIPANPYIPKNSTSSTTVSPFVTVANRT